MNAPSFETLLAMGRLPIAALFGPTSERGGENPGPSGPEGERVGDSDDEDADDETTNKDLDPIPGPGAPVVPDHATIDSNPIDPRVF